MTSKLNTTTKRFPRSMAEAFPDVRAYCVEVYTPQSRFGRRFVWAAVFVFVTLSFVIMSLNA